MDYVTIQHLHIQLYALDEFQLWQTTQMQTLR